MTLATRMPSFRRAGSPTELLFLRPFRGFDGTVGGLYLANATEGCGVRVFAEREQEGRGLELIAMIGRKS